MTRLKLKSGQMSKGFIFNINKCAGCRSCIAACSLENSWVVQPRDIMIVNEELTDNLPVWNISLACNHCEKPVCLEGCPAQSYYRDENTGAIILNENRCIGCRYCQWNCPFDAPKFDLDRHVIGKCNLCYKGVSEGKLPACVSACPTGALMFGDIHRPENSMNFPGKELKPSLQFSGKIQEKPLIVIPENKAEKTKKNKVERKNPEWSLVLFSFLATLSVSYNVVSFFNNSFPDALISLILLFSTGLVSLLHLGKKERAWRALTNIKSSPLSREIGAFLIFGITSLLTIFTKSTGFLAISAITGGIFLIAIDAVYWYSDKGRNIFMHSGQTFLSSILIVGFFTGNLILFILPVALKLLSMLYSIILRRNFDKHLLFRLFRITILVATTFYLAFSGEKLIFMTILFLSGELSDRILYYIDFEPLKFKKSIHNLI